MAAEPSLTFFSKKPIECPVCGTKLFREDMRTGRGRQIAGNLTRELRRHYEPSKQYGEVFPLLYPVTVCPECNYAAYGDDFVNVPPDAALALERATAERTSSLEKIFPLLDFREPRLLKEGVASYHFAIFSYEHFPKQFSPVFKQGLSSLRAAWLCGDLHKKSPGDNWDYLAAVYYRKARFFYALAVQYEQDGTQALSGARTLGPDLDKNYGYDGVLYISGLLEYHHGPRSDAEQREAALDRAKKTVARIFGMGKASKNKPAAILDNARDVYDEISRELAELRGEEES